MRNDFEFFFFKRCGHWKRNNFDFVNHFTYYTLFNLFTRLFVDLNVVNLNYDKKNVDFFCFVFCIS